MVIIETGRCEKLDFSAADQILVAWVASTLSSSFSLHYQPTECAACQDNAIHQICLE